jgi:flagellar motor switch protein FliG
VSTTTTSLTAAEMTGTQKTAVLLMALGTERAAQVLRQMREEEVTEIMGEVARLGAVSPEVIGDVLQEFESSNHSRMQVAQGGPAVARQLLEVSLGPDRAHEIVDRMSTVFVAPPFAAIAKVDPKMVLSYLRDEHPQTIALVLAHMPPDSATRVLVGLTESEQRDVAIRIAQMGPTTAEVVATVEDALQQRLAGVTQQGDLESAGGIDRLVEVLTSADPELEQFLLEGLQEHDAALADEVRARMFVFDDIVGIADRSVQQILRQVESRDLALALKGVGSEVRQKVLSNLSSRAAENLEVEIEVLGAVRLADVEEAQATVIAVIRKMEEDGQIVVARGNDEFVE